MTKRTADDICEAKTMRDRFDMLQMCNLYMPKKGRKSLPRSMMKTVAYLMAKPLVFEHYATVGAIAISHDGTEMMTGEFAGRLTVWNTAGEKLSTGDQGPVRAAEYLRDGKIMVARCDHYPVFAGIFDPKTRAYAEKKIIVDLEVRCVALSSNASVIAFSVYGGLVGVWHYDTDQVVKMIDCAKIVFFSEIAISPDGAAVAAVSNEVDIQLWDAKTGACKIELRGSPFLTEEVTFSPDGTVVVTGARSPCGSVIKVRDVNTGTCTAKIECETRYVRSIAFLPNGSAFVAACGDNRVRMFDAKTGACTLVMVVGRDSHIIKVVVSPDGNTIASADVGATVMLWDVKTGRLRHEW